MSGRKITIDGNLDPLKKSILGVSKLLQKDFGKSKIELINPETRKFFQTEAAKGVRSLDAALGHMNATLKKQVAAFSTMKGSLKDQEKAKLAILALEEKLLEKAEARSRLEKAAGLNKERTFGHQFQRRLGLGKLGAAYEEQGMAGMAGGALAGAGIAALLYGGSRVMAGRQTYLSGIPDRLKMMGRGMNDLAPSDMGQTSDAGLNALTLRSARLRDIDVFGKEGASQESVIRRARLERGYGLDEGTFSGAGAQLRPTLGGKGADVTIMKLQASLIASGIKDAIGPYLDTATSLLSDINEKGFVNDESILGLFNTLMKSGAGEGKISSLMGGMDQGIRGSTGEANAFWQNVLNKAGVGGGTVGGTQAAVQMGGLFGANVGKDALMDERSKNTFRQLGISREGESDPGAYTRTVARETLKQLGDDNPELLRLEGSKKPEDQARAANMRLVEFRKAAMAMGLKGPQQGAEAISVLRKAVAEGGSPEDLKKAIEDMKEKDPQIEALDKINKSIDGQTDILAATRKSIEDDIGKVTADGFLVANKFLADIDRVLAGTLGLFLPKGDKTTAQEDVDAYKKANPEGDFITDLFTPADELARQNQSKKQAAMFGADVAAGSPAGKAPASLDPNFKTIVEQLKIANIFHGITAKNSKEKGALAPITPSTVGPH